MVTKGYQKGVYERVTKGIRVETGRSKRIRLIGREERTLV